MDLDVANRSSLGYLMYLLWTLPACMLIDIKPSARFLQEGFEAAPDLILWVPNIDESWTKGVICRLISFLSVVYDTPLQLWKYFLESGLTIRFTKSKREWFDFGRQRSGKCQDDVFPTPEKNLKFFEIYGRAWLAQLVRSLPFNHKVPSSIPGSAKIWIDLCDFLPRLN